MQSTAGAATHHHVNITHIGSQETPAAHRVAAAPVATGDISEQLANTRTAL